MRILLRVILILLSAKCFAQNIDSKIFEISNPENTFITIIANENYQQLSSDYIANVTHAILEGETFKQKLIKKYGVPQTNISFYPDANETQIKLGVAKVSKQTQNTRIKSEIIIYYTGRIVLEETTNETYLLPVNTTINSLIDAVNLEYIYQKLQLSKSQKITVLIDGELVDMSRAASLLKDGGAVQEIKNSSISGYTTTRIANQTILELQAESIHKTPELTPIEIETKKSDTIPPVLIINTPETNPLTLTNQNSLLIEGKVSDNQGIYIISVNGQEAHLNDDGSFRARVQLKENPGTIYIQAIDIHKNISNKEIFIKQNTREDLSPSSKDLSRDMATEELTSTIKYYALLIGVNEYQDPLMPNLDGPLSDVSKIEKILTSNYSFPQDQVYVLRNPTREQIIQKFDDLEENLTSNDNLLIFFAGHGTWDERVKKGYWLPSDARRHNTANWIRNSTVSGYISGIQSKHTLLISDACFGGGIFKTRSIPESLDAIRKIYELSSRKAMTSGTLKRVPDKSVFSEYFTKRLAENKEKYLPAGQLFYSFKPAVLNNSENIPQYGVIKNAGDEGGDFIFIRK